MAGSQNQADVFQMLGEPLGAFNYPWHDLTIGAVAHMVLLSVGYMASRCVGRAETVSAAGLR